MDVAKLKYYISIRGKSLASYGNALGISKTALWRKMKLQSEFTREEIQKTILFLNLSENEVIEIFFAHNVS